MGVVRRHDDDVIERHRAHHALGVGPVGAAREELLDEPDDLGRLLGRIGVVARVGDGDVAHAGAVERRPVREQRRPVRRHDLALVAGMRFEPAVVEHLGGERADVRVQPPRLARGTARPCRGSSRRSPRRCAEGAPLGAGRMAALESAGRAAAGRRAARSSAPPARTASDVREATSGPPRPRTARRGPARASPSRPGPTCHAVRAHDVDLGRRGAPPRTSALSVIEVAPSKVGSRRPRASGRCGPRRPRSLATRRRPSSAGSRSPCGCWRSPRPSSQPARAPTIICAPV